MTSSIMQLSTYRSCVQKFRVFPLHIRAPIFVKAFILNRYYTSTAKVIKQIKLDVSVSYQSKSNSGLQPLPITAVNLKSSNSTAVLPSEISFSDLGIRPPLAKALSQAFNITNPTVSQQQFISAILSGRDIFLRNQTGTGKTLGIVLALLNLPRATYTRPDGSCIPTITSLIIVPNRELAFQIESWAHALVPLKESTDFKTVMQVVAKRMDDASEAEKELHRQITDLKKMPPHVLVGTPTQLMRVANKNELFVSELQTVVLDEIDRTLSLRINWKTKKNSPRPVEDLLNYIFDRMRITQSKRLHEQWKKAIRKSKDGMNKKIDLPRELKFRKPQVIASSATMKRELRFFMAQRKWINNALFVDVTKGSEGPASTIHHCIMVSNNRVRNIIPRIDDKDESQNKDKEEKNDDEINIRRDKNGNNEEATAKSIINRKTRNNRYNAYIALDGEDEEDGDDEEDEDEDEDEDEKDYDDEMLDNVATACELENVQRAIIFVKEGTNIRSLSNRFQHFGITACQLIKSFGNPDPLAPSLPLSTQSPEDLGASPLPKTSTTLLISTPQSARGIDIPNLTHVFILGRPYSTTDYLHMAGRTGRMGRSGKVISFVRDKGDAEKKMAWMYWISKINVQPYEHIE